MEPAVLPRGGPKPIVGVFTAIIALLAAIVALSIIENVAWRGAGAAIGSGAFLGFALAALFAGVMIAIQKPVRWVIALGVLTLVTAASAVAGPPTSLANEKAKEEALWKERVDEEKGADVNPYSWDIDYEHRVPPALQRPERVHRRMVARALYATRQHDLSDLRRLLAETSAPADATKFDEARAVARKTLGEAYTKGIAKLRAEPLPVGGSDVAMDPALRAAFATLLDDLAGAPSSLVDVAFEARFDVTPPKGTDVALALARRQLFASHRYPNANAPVIEPGDAFRHDRARLGTFIKALDESFKSALDPDLLSFSILPPGADRKGQLVLSIAPSLERTTEFTPLDSSTVGKDDAKVTGLLFGFEVHWRFAIQDRAGKELYRSQDIVTEPADKIHAETGAHDPDWAMYSVFLDSAYYAFSRQLTGRFGLPPPAPRERFHYEP